MSYTINRVFQNSRFDDSNAGTRAALADERFGIETDDNAADAETRPVTPVMTRRSGSV